MAEASPDNVKAEPAELPPTTDDAMGGDAEQAAPPPKRQRRMDVDERQRGQRLMGNLLGTLSKFKGEEKARAATQKARQRDEIAKKVQERLQSETQRTHEITQLEKTAKTCRLEIESKEVQLSSRRVMTRSRAQQLPRLAQCLSTSSGSAPHGPPPLSLAPLRSRAAAEEPRPIFYLPKVLSDEQKDALQRQANETKELIEQEAEEFAAFQTRTEEELQELRNKVQEARAKLDELRGVSVRDDLPIAGQEQVDDGARESGADADMQVDADPVRT